MELIGWIISQPFICLGWVIIGFVAGALSHRFMKTGNQPFYIDIIVGLIGAVIGGFLVGVLNIARPETGLTGFIVNLIVATVGAVVLQFVLRAIRGGR